MNDKFKIVDSDFVEEATGRKQGSAKWAELYEVLDSLEPGKWVNVPIAENEVSTHIATNLQASARASRKPYRIKVATRRNPDLLFVTKVPLK